MWCRTNLKKMFRGKLWLDVLSKADLLEEEFDAADELTATRQVFVASAGAGACNPMTDGTAAPQLDSGSGAAVDGSADEGLESTGEGAESLGVRVLEGANAGAPSWSGWQAAGRSGDDAGSSGSESEITTAVELVAALPNAIRVSSMTNVGLDTLKVRYCGMVADVTPYNLVLTVA